MTLREFLVKNAPHAEQEQRRRQLRQEWIAAVDRLIAQMRAWIVEAGTADLLNLAPLEFEHREQGLGAYNIRGLAINYGTCTVKVVPAGRIVHFHLGPYAEPGHESAEGRVDISSAYNKYYLYRKLNASGDEKWLIQNERSALRPLDREQFEAILQDLLS